MSGGGFGRRGKREERNASYLLLSVWKIGILGTTTASESYNIFSQDSQGVVPAPCLLADGEEGGVTMNRE